LSRPQCEDNEMLMYGYLDIIVNRELHSIVSAQWAIQTTSLKATHSWDHKKSSIWHENTNVQ